MKLVTIAVLASTAFVATPAHAGTSWWGSWGGWWNQNVNHDHGWNGWNNNDDCDDLDEEFCEDNDNHGWNWGGDCDATPEPTGVPEIDANLLGTGLLLLVGGGLVLTSRSRLG